MMEKDVRCLILMGGQGRRMGWVDKGELEFEGKTFLQRITDELAPLGLPRVFSTADREDLTGGEGSLYVKDILKLADGGGVGPMGGLWSCFQKTGAEGFFTVSCDMPLFRRSMFQELLCRMRPEQDALLWRTRDGRIHPVCGYYSRTCLPALTKALESGDYRMMRFISELNCGIVDAREAHIPDSWFTNINSPQALEDLHRRRVPVLAVSGRKNTGKTTLLESLVKTLSRAGIRTAVIKHDGHEFEADVPGTDSRRMKEAGAYGTAVYSASRFSVVKEQRGLEAADLFSFFPEADIILLEGQKNSDYWKLETVRSEIAAVPVCRPHRVLAYVSDGEVDQREAMPEREADQAAHQAGPDLRGLKPVYRFEDTHELAELIVGVLDGHF